MGQAGKRRREVGRGGRCLEKDWRENGKNLVEWSLDNASGSEVREVWVGIPSVK